MESASFDYRTRSVAVRVPPDAKDEWRERGEQPERSSEAADDDAQPAAGAAAEVGIRVVGAQPVEADHRGREPDREAREHDADPRELVGDARVHVAVAAGIQR